MALSLEEAAVVAAAVEEAEVECPLSSLVRSALPQAQTTASHLVRCRVVLLGLLGGRQAR